MDNKKEKDLQITLSREILQRCRRASNDCGSIRMTEDIAKLLEENKDTHFSVSREFFRNCQLDAYDAGDHWLGDELEEILNPKQCQSTTQCLACGKEVPEGVTPCPECDTYICGCCGNAYQGYCGNCSSGVG